MAVATFERDWLEPLLYFLEDAANTGPGRRGKSYWSAGRVLELDLASSPCDFLARVSGGAPDPYNVVLSRQRGVVVSTCTCQAHIYCKHGIAAGLALLDLGIRLDLHWAIDVEMALPVFRRGYASPPPPTVSERLLDEIAGNGVLVPGATSQSKSKKASGNRARRVIKPPWWQEFLDAKSTEARRSALLAGVLSRIIASPHSWAVTELVSDMERADNSVETLELFDRKVERFAQMMRFQTRQRNPELEVFLASPAVQELSAIYARQAAHDHLLRWLQRSASDPAAENWARVELIWIVIAQPGGIGLLHFQLLLTAKKLQRSPRSVSAISLLAKEVSARKRALSNDEARLVQWVAESVCAPGPVYPRYENTTSGPRGSVFEAIPVHDGIGWLNLWSHSRMLLWEDGAVVELHAKPARLEVQLATDEIPRWSVAFPEAASAPILIDQVELVADHGKTRSNQSEPTVFARRGAMLYRLECGGMPFHVLEGLVRIPEVPVERLRESRAGAELARRLMSPGQESADGVMVDTVSVKPFAEFRLDAESNLAVVASALSANNVAFCWAPPGQWECRGASAPSDNNDENALADMSSDQSPSEVNVDDPGNTSKPHAIAVIPRRQDVAPLESWLDAAIPPHAHYGVTDDQTPCRRWRMRGGELGEFLRHWGARPPGVRYLGNRAFQSMVSIRRPPRVSVHIEPSGMDWLQVSVDLEKDIEALSLDEVMSALKASEDQLVTLPGGRNYRRDELEDYRKQVEALGGLGLAAETATQRLHVIQLAGTAVEILDEMGQSHGQLKELASHVRQMLRAFKGVPKAELPKKTASHLRPYQRAGVDFLVWAADAFGGALLADDMGLGKTLQVLAALTALQKKHGIRRPSLVVCPASVAHNWQREAERFTPSLRVVVIERGQGRHEKLAQLDDYDLVVKNYALTRRDLETLKGYEWLMVCVDEAQAIKNSDADISRAVKSLSAHYRFALTGTPIENRLADLWSIMDFVAPGYLESLRRFEQRAKGAESKTASAFLRARLRPVLLRRLKSEVAPELPPRIEERRDCAMTPAQRKVYAAEVQRTRLLLDGLKTEQVVGKDRIQILAALTRLRQLCCDPALVNIPNTGSGKVVELMELLPPLLEAGHKILLFSQFVRMLKRLQGSLNEQGIATYMLTGETTRRQALVDRFESDSSPSVFLISLKAGGTGLNLVSASHVILFDPWWNPAVEAQAIDRTHRIGQDKTVIAFRLVSMGTVEERILELQERKRNIVKDVLEEGTFNRSLTREDFEFLLDEPK